MPNHPEYWEGSPEFERDEPDFPVCERCGCEFDPDRAYRYRWNGIKWKACDPCNGWEDVE